MSDDLVKLHNFLKYIREYLVKLGPDKRNSDLAFKKVELAKLEYDKLAYILSQVSLQIDSSELSSEATIFVNKLVEDIHILYNKIIKLVDPISVEKVIEMATENFDLKTAIALLPIMNGKEEITKQLIESIELYSSMIKNEAQQQLINFVLKTRLSPSAKLRLDTNYTNTSVLIKDMRSKLLQKLSSVTIQSQLQRSKQGHRTIESFGSELESLFVNLTIAQADGDDSAYQILRPLNEKMAIKRFSDGLSDPRLSTIIASRTFSSLPEAIRTAMDEKSMSTSTEPEVMRVRHVNFGSQARGRSRQTSHRQSDFRSNYPARYKGTQNYYNSNFQNNTPSYGNFTRSGIVTNNNYQRNNYLGNSNQRGFAAPRRIYRNASETRPRSWRSAPRVQHTQHSADFNEDNAHHNNSQFFRT